MGFFKDSKIPLGGKYTPNNSQFTSATPPERNYTVTGGDGTTTLFTVGTNSTGGQRKLTLSGELPNGFRFNETTGELSGSYQYSALNTNFRVFNFTITSESTNPSTPNITVSDSRDYSITVQVPWKFRQVITHGYMLGGYKDSSLWSNINRVTHANDTTTNLGDGVIDNFHYKSGATGMTKAYIWNTTTTAYNMRTEVKSNSGQNPGAGNNGTAFNEAYYAYANGEGVGQIKKFRFSDETFISNLGSGWTDHAASISGEYRGIFWGNSGQTQRIYFPTDAIANMGYSAGAHGQQKGMMAKTGFGYGGAQGTYNGGYQFRRTNIESEAQSGTYTKPRGNCGEENYGMGQDAGYMIGNYDGGGQNNGSFKYTYATDSGFNGGATMEPKGHGGCSSGHMAWRD